MQKGLKVVEHDVTADRLSQEEILKLVTKDGHMRGPIITRGDEVIAFGYNRDKLEQSFS